MGERGTFFPIFTLSLSPLSQIPFLKLDQKFKRVREKERERQRERERDKERERQRERERDKERIYSPIFTLSLSPLSLSQIPFLKLDHSS